MTIIVWDGTTLAADRQCSDNGTARSTTKVKRIGASIVAGCGSSAGVRELIHWFSTGCDPDKYPESQRTESDRLVVISPGPVIDVYEGTPHPMTFEDKCFTAGSGCDFATAGLHLGMNAVDAVKLACELDIGCGGGIDSMELLT